MQAPAAPFSLTNGDREILSRVAGSRTASHRQVLRARVLLLADAGVGEFGYCGRGRGECVDASVLAVSVRFRWVARLGRVADGWGRKPLLSQAKIDEIFDLTRNCRPEGQTH